MNKNLDSLLVPIKALSDDEVSKPTEGDIATLENIDLAINLPMCELEKLAEATRLRIKASGSPLFGMLTFMRLGYGAPRDLCSVLSDIDALKIEHHRRVDLILAILHDEDIQESEAGIKSAASIVRRLEQAEAGRSAHVPDVSRMRVVFKDLKALENAQNVVEARLPEHGLLRVARKNRYGDRVGRLEESNGKLMGLAHFGLIDHYRAISSGWVSNQSNALGRMPTELMFATQRATACSRLNQPYRLLSQRLHWPNKEARNWMLALMHKANILDYQKYLEYILK